ncbi:MAG: rhamnogalacturonan acetylesterase [Alicyclobacillus herbarius]|uniref:rhamnogalacturonan acetylesterase n=1 Tax=Alicyclobacillus herbarius TaxID=122960 RepID=UPI000400C620|nr:rhamnogalacturonan acetylesterase [Alicyclobacillus herbarius]MCL6633149.1 rhamnogalacturonan acetylesterase [Alicyclobacillus herbarius]
MSKTSTDRIRVFLAGDSTVQTYEKDFAPQAGWGQFIDRYFDEKVVFFNHAIGGRSSKTFVEEGRLDDILRQLAAGDYLFIQMGHNDSTVSKPERYTEPFTTYKRYLKMYVDGARRKHAYPILITPVGRLHYDSGCYINDFPDYCEAMKQLARDENVPLIDLMTKSLVCFAELGYDEAHTWFMASITGSDFTHFTEKGAYQVARLVAQGVQDLNIDLSSHVVTLVGTE